MLKQPALTIDGINYPGVVQPLVLVADGEATEFGTLDDTRRHLRCLQLNGRYPEAVRLFNLVNGDWLEVPL